MVRDLRYATQLYYFCMELLGVIHDACDMGMVSALITVMAANAIMILPPDKGIPLALNYVSIAESICETLGTTDSEVTNYCINFR